MPPRSLLFAALMLLAINSPALPHDNWINKGGYRNTAGEWCCGATDCFSLSGEEVVITSAGYMLRALNEVVPFNEVQPSPDGAFWRCKRADGTRRCFFAPPTSS